jgi:hypothetical protein
MDGGVQPRDQRRAALQAVRREVMMKTALKIGLALFFVTSCQPAINTFHTKSGRTGLSLSIHTWGSSSEKSEVVATK